MYIVNPFRKKDVKFSDLSSTHPPISERIRILRAMSGASFSYYDQAYRQVHRGGGGIIPAAGLTGDSVPLIETAPQIKVEEPGETQRARETSDVMWRLNNYKTITCDCGTKLRVPPGFKETSITCPRCHRSYPV
jgi:heat shock protein HtpX